MSLHYRIEVSKDHAQVTAKWDISVDMVPTLRHYQIPCLIAR